VMCSILNLTINLHKPVERELLFEDLLEHIAPMIVEGFHCGEMCVSVSGDGDEEYDEVSGWWELNYNSATQR
jgi:hypothetical protein